MPFVHAAELVSSTDALSYTTPAFVPTAGDLLVAIVTVSDGNAASPGTVTDSAGGSWFNNLNRSYGPAPSDFVRTYYRTTAAPASSMTATWTGFSNLGAGNPVGGCCITVLRVRNPLYYGTAAIKQTTSASVAAGNTPTRTFGTAVLTDNVTICGVSAGDSSGPSVTPPTGWTERQDNGYATPDNGQEYVTRGPGFTGTVVTWGSACAAAFGVWASEIYHTGIVPPPITYPDTPPTPQWHNNARRVAFKAAQARPLERVSMPRPIWSFALDERYVDALVIRPRDGGVPAGALAAAGTFVIGPYYSGRARDIGASTTNRVDLAAQHAATLAGHKAVTALAWVQRTSTAVERGVLTLAHAAGNAKLELYLAAGVNVALRARGASTDTLRTITSAGLLTDTVRHHLIGGFVDVANDLMGAFLDDAGQPAAATGFYETAAAAFTATEFSAEAHAAECAIGCSGGIANPWAGTIATVAVYNGVLTPEQVNAIWRAGRRGVVR